MAAAILKEGADPAERHSLRLREQAHLPVIVERHTVLLANPHPSFVVPEHHDASRCRLAQGCHPNQPTPRQAKQPQLRVEEPGGSLRVNRNVNEMPRIAAAQGDWADAPSLDSEYAVHASRPEGP